MGIYPPRESNLRLHRQDFLLGRVSRPWTTSTLPPSAFSALSGLLLSFNMSFIVPIASRSSLVFSAFPFFGVDLSFYDGGNGRTVAVPSTLSVSYSFDHVRVASEHRKRPSCSSPFLWHFAFIFFFFFHPNRQRRQKAPLSVRPVPRTSRGLLRLSA